VWFTAALRSLPSPHDPNGANFVTATSPVEPASTRIDVLCAAVKGKVNASGQGTGTCPVCGRAGKFRFLVDDHDLLLLDCKICDGAQGEGDDRLPWLAEVREALPGVPEWVFGHSAQPARSGLGAAPPLPTLAELRPAPKLPTERSLSELADALQSERVFLHGLTAKLNLDAGELREAGIGYDRATGRVIIPVEDPSTGELLTVIRRNFAEDADPKTKSMVAAGSSGAYVYAPFGIRTDEPVLICAGEKDALIACGYGYNAIAFTNGEGGVPTEPRLRCLFGLDVILLYDDDAAGHKGAPRVAAGLWPMVATVRIADLSLLGLPNEPDVYDVLHSDLGTDGLDRVLAAATSWEGGPRVALGLTTDPQVLKQVEKLRTDDAARRIFRAEQMTARNQAASARGRRVMDGAEFILDLSDARPTLWGLGDQVLWMEGEGLLLVGSDGTGKTTIAQQLLLSRLGVRGTLLDFPVARAEGRVLYLAMDRPDQARRSFARMIPKDFHDEYRDVLRERLVTWSGPLPVDPLSAPEALAEWITGTHGSDITDVFVDSYKDLAPGLSEDAVGSGLNSAMQEVLARGINWLGLHHQRKANGDNKTPIALSDVYGSRWLTAGQGSVLMIAGDAGDCVVELRHLKEPLAKVPTLVISHDHANGRTTRVEHHMDPLDVVQGAGSDGVTVNDVCQAMYPGKADDPAIKKRVVRALKRLADHDDRVSVIPVTRGGEGGYLAHRCMALVPADVYIVESLDAEDGHPDAVALGLRRESDEEAGAVAVLSPTAAKGIASDRMPPLQAVTVALRRADRTLGVITAHRAAPFTVEDRALLSALAAYGAAALQALSNPGSQESVLSQLLNTSDESRVAAILESRGWRQGTPVVPVVLLCDPEMRLTSRRSLDSVTQTVESVFVGKRRRSLRAASGVVGALLFGRVLDQELALTAAELQHEVGVSLTDKGQVAGVAVGLGRCVTDPQAIAVELRSAYDAAGWAALMGTGVRSWISSDNDLTHKLFAVSRELAPDVARYVARMRRIKDYDERHGTDLLQTLAVFVRERGAAQQASEQLFIHRNTLRQRLNKISSLLDEPIEQVEDWLPVSLAVKVLKT